jgi:hypothetical protein
VVPLPLPRPVAASSPTRAPPRCHVAL